MSLLQEKATSSVISSAISGEADIFTTYTKNKNKCFYCSRIQTAQFKFYDNTDPNHMYPGRAFAH